MSKLSEKFAALSPAQRELLARRLEKKGWPILAETEADASSPAVGGAHDARDNATRPIQFSLFFFSDDGAKNTADKYRLLLESAKYADEHGFAAVWTPERHCQRFGGLYPNPSVLGAALAVSTRRIQIRAGSVALPLHHPLRVAEEWAVVDNLSNGRVGVSFASGWHPDDFVLSPATYHERKEYMFRHVETLRRLWAGEAVKFPRPDGVEVEVTSLPRPVQAQLPIWITSSGTRETWVRAGQIGANILSGMKGEPGQDLAGKIAAYREARALSGHDPQTGCVTVMLHTYVGADTQAVKEKVRAPLTGYLRTFIAQGDQLNARQLGVDGARATEADKDALAAFAFERFFNTSSLLGARDKCARLVADLRRVGVDEIACLIDFGLAADEIMAGLHHLNELRADCTQSASAAANPIRAEQSLT